MNNEVVFFLEEESAKALLEKVFRRLCPPQTEVQARFVVFEGKQDLEKRLRIKLSGYLNPNARFIILRDQDAAECEKVKDSIRRLCEMAGRPERSRGAGKLTEAKRMLRVASLAG